MENIKVFFYNDLALRLQTLGEEYRETRSEETFKEWKRIYEEMTRRQKDS